MMDNFITIADQYLENLLSLIEDKDTDCLIDCNYLDGVLSLSFIDKAIEYVINRNEASKKIWVSSPISGASYFSYIVASNSWRTDGGEDLYEKLISEIDSHLSRINSQF